MSVSSDFKDQEGNAFSNASIFGYLWRVEEEFWGRVWLRSPRWIISLLNTVMLVPAFWCLIFFCVIEHMTWFCTLTHWAKLHYKWRSQKCLFLPFCLIDQYMVLVMWTEVVLQASIWASCNNNFHEMWWFIFIFDVVVFTIIKYMEIWACRLM